MHNLFLLTASVLTPALFSTGVIAQDATRRKIADLIASLEKDRSSIIQLVKTTGRDFGVRPKLWGSWLEQTSDKDLVKVAERQRRLEELDRDWRRFALGCSNMFFASLGGDPEKLAKAKAEWNAIQKESREPDAWDGFTTAIWQLEKSGNRSKSANKFRDLFHRVPLSHYAAETDELAILLTKMADEDRLWNEPQKVDSLSLEAKVKYYAYHLRNVSVEQPSQPGKCNVLSSNERIGVPNSQNGNAAIQLMKIGKDSIPALIELLDDRRPIRSVGYFRNYWPERTVLRYQDAARQILEVLLPVTFDDGCTGDYLSKESPEVRYRMINQIRDWYKNSQGKSEADKLWLAIKMEPGIHSSIKLFRILAKEHGQKREVLKELDTRYQRLHRVYRPFLVELMAELGDRSKVKDIERMLEDDEFHRYFSERFPDDSMAFARAEQSAIRLVKKYGSDSKK